ncbi:hypothetical protein GCM10027088_19610 [Nocardia goodfellowii]
MEVTAEGFSGAAEAVPPSSVVVNAAVSATAAMLRRAESFTASKSVADTEPLRDSAVDHQRDRSGIEKLEPVPRA